MSPTACSSAGVGARPLESLTWLTAMQAVTSRCGADPARLAGMGAEAFIALVRAGVGEWGGKKAHGPIIARVFAALTDTEAWWRRPAAACAGNDDQEAANARRILGEIFSEYTAGSTVPPHPCPAPTVY
jgi:hypothetical protein